MSVEPIFAVFARVHHLDGVTHEQLSHGQRMQWVRWCASTSREFATANPEWKDERSGGRKSGSESAYLAWLSAKYGKAAV